MNKKILDLAIPNIISNITIPLLGLVGGKINVSSVSKHLESNIYVVEKFLDVKFKIDGNIISTQSAKKF